MKQIIYISMGKYYMTPKNNYDAYIADNQKIHLLEGVHTLEDALQFVDNCCKWYGDTPDNYIIKA